MMLTQLLAFGLIGAATGGGGGPITDTGTTIATAKRTVVLADVQAVTPAAAGVALGATGWAQPLDPADHTPYAIDFTALLGSAEKIAQIDAIVLNATAALLGIQVDTATAYRPIIDTAGKKIQLWFVTDPGEWDDAAFNASGVQLPVTVRILTDSTPPKRYERTCVGTVRQL